MKKVLINSTQSNRITKNLKEFKSIKKEYRALWDLFYLADLSGNAAWL
jgi:hypothetical protein